MTASRQHALVTGGSRGIGAAIVERLHRQGYNVSIVARGLAAAEKLASRDPDHLMALTADVSSREQVTAAFASANQRFGSVHLLINCAGIAPSGKFMSTSEELWQQTLDVNLNGVMYCMQAALPAMQAANSGRIVNVASTAGLVGYAYVSAYCAAKHAVIGLTRSLALELAKTGITVNAVCPGYTDTDIMHDSIARIVERTGRSKEEALSVFTKTNPQGRLVKPGEVADTVAWLCGDGAAAVTGQSISVSGGEVV